MVPQTYPSILNPYTNRHEMVVKQLASTSGLQRWTDYIPVKLSASTRPAGEQTTDSDGFIAINTGQDTSTGVAFKDWVPVYFDNDATDAWVVSASGYIPIGASGGAIAILKSYGTDAHVYLPGANGVVVSGLLTNNYTLSDGSTGYSAVDGTAGLVLDAAGSVGTELVDSPVNGTASGSWVVNTSGVTRNGSLTGQAAVNVSSAATLPVTKTYKVTFTTSGMSGDSIGFRIGGGTAYGPIASDGTYTYIVQGGGSTNLVFIPWSGTLGQATITGMSVKEVTGIHATQATTANKPAVRRGLYNLALNSNNLTAWTSTAATTPTSSTLIEDSSSASHYISQNFSVTIGSSYTWVAMVKQNGRQCVQWNYSGLPAANFDISTGVVNSTQTSDAYFNTYSASIAPIGNGEFLVAVSANCIQSLAGNPRIYLASTAGFSTLSAPSYLGDGTSGVQINGIAFLTGRYTAAQILAEGIPLTTSAAASNQSAGRYSWQFDGTNDSLALGSVPFQMSDDHCVIAGFRPDAGDVAVVGITNAGGTTMCGILRLASDGVLSAWWKDDVAAQSLIYGSGSVIGSTLVASAQKVGNVKSLRSNGTQVATDSTVLGTTTLTNANIGSLASVGGFMNGATGPVILIKGTISDSDLLTLERWVASQMPNGPQF